nr:hypothetical protein GCM10020092_072220 [Actinoplanes digitatis]
MNPTHNSLGGSQFDTSCSGGYSGGPEYWCADFAKWVWRNSGFNTSGLTPAAQSFYTYGQSHGTFHATAQPGDAIVFSDNRGGYANHVAVVTAVNSDGSVVIANGNWGGQSGTMAHFATTSSVKQATIPASAASTGSWVAVEGYYITGIVGASGTGGGTPPDPGGNPHSATALCGDGYGVIDTHQLARRDGLPDLQQRPRKELRRHARRRRRRRGRDERDPRGAGRRLRRRSGHLHLVRGGWPRPTRRTPA